MSSTTQHRVVTMAATLAALALCAWPLASTADTATEKAGRGLAAITTPFLEIPGNVVATAEREGATRAWTEGLVRGIGMSVVRPAIGLYELVTAPIPAPSNFEPILEPEYPWSYFGPGDDTGRARG